MGGEVWGFLWIMLALKIPLAMLLYIVWYAIKAVPDPAAEDGRDGGIGNPRHPRKPGPAAPRRRGPHGDPVLPAPPRTRTPAKAREREPERPVR
ncbi:MAG TPA: hypothetical protein VF549_08940 [Solirubrobacteraceae bacterium]